ncbi:MAG TPA: hypothetical protein VIX19_10815 [Terriglobales bacterium]
MSLDLLSLLEQAGARVRGRRADCPSCKRRRAVSINPEEGVYCCHGLDCDFRGNSNLLARQLGISREWLPRREFLRRLRLERRADAMARYLYSRLQSRRFELLDEFRALDRLRHRAIAAGEGHGAFWDALAFIYQRQSVIEAELDALESASARQLIPLISA